MSGLRQVVLGIRALLRRQRRRDEIDEELRSYLEASAEARVRGGSSPEDARRAARVDMGSVEAVKDAVADATWEGRVDAFARDVRHGLRLLRRSPGFTLVAVLTLALGIGANTAIFSIINAVLLQPLPFDRPAQLVQLWETESAPGNFPLTGPDYLDWQARNHTLAATSLHSWPRRVSASGAGQPEPAIVVDTQANFFATLGATPLLGRTFARGEDRAGKNRVVVLSYGFWQRRFGGRSDAVGRRIDLDGESCLIVGVMPIGFRFPVTTEIWMPIDMTPEQIGSSGSHQWRAIARLKPNVGADQARADLTLVERRLAKVRPDNDTDVQAIVIPLKEQVTHGWRTQLLLLLGAVLLVLLVACANLANLLLARATGRAREMAVRAALGASRGRLIRQMLTESVVLAVTGAAVGLAGAWYAVKALPSATTFGIPQVTAIRLDGTVLLVTAVASMAVGVLFGLAPALQTSAFGLSDELKSSALSVAGPAGRGKRLRDSLVVAEIALSLTLLVGAGLMMRSFVNMRTAAIGVQTDRILTASVSLPDAGYATPSARRSFYQTLLAKLQEEPGIAAAALSTEIPLEGGRNGYVKIPGNTSPGAQAQIVEWNFVTPSYFHAYGIPLLKGRNFHPDEIRRAGEAADRIASAVKQGERPPQVAAFPAIINRCMAQTFWPHVDPIGQVFNSGSVGQSIVIGVVADVKEQRIRGEAYPEAYYPIEADLAFEGLAHVTMATHIPPSYMLPTLQAAVRSLDAGLAVFKPRTMDQVVVENMQDTSVQTSLLGSFAALALVLAAIGLYGVMSYLVSERTHEIGVRMALGARPRDVLRLVLAHGTRLTAAGITVGLAGAVALTRVMSAMLFGVSATDPLTFVAVAALLVAVALATCYLPARRATRIDPMRALRGD